ncbi:MAG: type I glyceraldehyde-3-phosphate dehydrogenase [Flavobacteriales bacterium]
MEKTRIAINGFGRIGRTLARLVIHHPQIELVAINDLADAKTMAHLFKYDSVHGKWSGSISHTADTIEIDGHSIRFTSHKRIEDIDWESMDVDIVVECTGTLKTRSEVEQHLVSGARRVLLSAPPEDDLIPSVVLGVNETALSSGETIISNASCTTNNAAPMIQLIDELCGIEGCYITTVHSYTGDQRLHDAPHRDLRRSRAAAVSIIPTTTGAAKALTRIFPHLADHMGGCGIRVPVPDGSLTDITCTVRKVLPIEEINRAFQNAALGRWKGIVEYTEDPIVSIDVVDNAHSCVFDAQLTSVIGNMVKVVGWYDNEFGYSNRLKDLILKWAL